MELQTFVSCKNAEMNNKCIAVLFQHKLGFHVLRFCHITKYELTDYVIKSISVTFRIFILISFIVAIYLFHKKHSAKNIQTHVELGWAEKRGLLDLHTRKIQQKMT